MPAGDLTTVERVRNHLGHTSQDADERLAELVTSSSEWVRSQLGRIISSTLVTEIRSGNGGARMLLDEASATPDSPPCSVTSVTVDGVTIPVRPAVSSSDTNPSGWALREYGVDLVGYTFGKGLKNVTLVYRIGYLVSGEARTIPAAPGPYTVQAAKFFTGTVAVTFAVGGAALTLVTGAPTTGQYSVSESGLHTFAAADAGLGVLLSYGTVPKDLEQAVVEHAALRYSDRKRIGLEVVSGGGEFANFGSGGLLAFVDGVLERYRAIGVG